MFEFTNRYYRVKDGAILAGPTGRPNSYGSADVAPLCAQETDGACWYQLWVESRGDAPGQYYTPVIGDVTVNTQEERCERVDTWEEWTSEQKRVSIQQEIDAQVPDASIKESVRDPLVQADISRSLAAATDKQTELQDTDDADLDTFDTILDVAPPQNGKGYSQFAVDIIELEPWAGAPDNYLGFEAVLNIQTRYEDQGAEARLYVFNAPADTGAVLPFVQDVEDPQKWSVNARDGFLWSDPNAECTVQLLWGAGALPTSSKLTCRGQNDRKAQVVRYAVPTTRRKRR